ncbi:hypothetical protein BN8_00512 [Fibrisoma limi BUZ 3]|uniref:Uncharacterized protein n=1 Tax=Fibrisoma limi BUZ 3 TaxID=1185876 RepID=I2GCF8_9BACT|nr:hypothetical protein [Fibrisoma limi]CCH51582.1 hypothetical protein BN8_00512 [Fibrisoma limi BUZ 3]
MRTGEDTISTQAVVFPVEFFGMNQRIDASEVMGKVVIDSVVLSSTR